jgi:hypothetical protein
MSKGVLLIANNNSQIDYVKQSVYLAKRIKKYLEVPVSIATNSPGYVTDCFDGTVFDKIITVTNEDDKNRRILFDGEYSQKTVQWQNGARVDAYDLSPYDQTLLMDTDFIINNSLLKNVFDSTNEFMIYKDAYELAQIRNTSEFKNVSDTSVDFYWATVVYFTKTDTNKIFFDLVKHVRQEWDHYVRVYRLPSSIYRNDYAFSIAIHIMNGFQAGSFVKKLPGKKYYATDRDVMIDHRADSMTFLVGKKDYPGEYTLLKTNSLNVHVMNKLSLQRVIDSQGAIAND